MTEMLAVHANLAARAERCRRSDLERGFLEHGQDRRRPRGLQGRPGGTECLARGGYIGFVIAEELRGVRPQQIECRLHARMRLLRSESQPDDPLARMTQMIARLFQALAGDRGESAVAACLQRLP